MVSSLFKGFSAFTTEAKVHELWYVETYQSADGPSHVTGNNTSPIVHLMRMFHPPCTFLMPAILSYILTNAEVTPIVNAGPQWNGLSLPGE